ncbi:MAG: OmpH family outer membrane protein [Syntrophobacter sp.]
MKVKRLRGKCTGIYKESELKKLCYVLVGVFLLALGGCGAEPPKIGVVNVVKVVNDSNEGKKANAELDTLVKAKQALVKEKADSVEKLKRAVEAAPSTAKKAKEDELRQASTEYQSLVSSSDAEVQKKAAELRNMVLERIKKVLESIGQEEQFLLILTNDNAPYFQKTIDISEKVIKKYNELADK